MVDGNSDFQLLRIDHHLVAAGLAHDLDGLVDVLQGEAVGDDFLGIHEPALHEADGALHGERRGAEAGVHARLQEVRETAVQLERLVRGDAEHVPLRATTEQADHLLHGRNRTGRLPPSAPAPSIQYRASNLDWQLISYMIFHMFQWKNFDHSFDFCASDWHVHILYFFLVQLWKVILF